MSNSPLISYSRISPNRNSPRSGKIKGIAIHCMAGQLSVETCGNVFAPTSRGASSNYGVGPDGRIGMYVEEKDRSWCTSTSLDNYLVTIEVASDKSEPYAVTAAAYEATIRLCADICKRNGIPALKWEANKSLAGNWDRQNMVVHRWFNLSKSCPGNYLYSRMGEIANRVNLLLDAGSGGSGNTTYCGKGVGEATALEQMEVRTAGRTTAASVGHVNKGQKVEVLQVLQTGWMKIVWPGDPRGYAYTSNVGGKYWSYKDYSRKVVAHGVVVNCDRLNVRTGAGVKYPLLPEWPQLARGNEVDVLDVKTAADGSAWFEIRIAGKYIGCVAAQYVKTTTIG